MKKINYLTLVVSIVMLCMIMVNTFTLFNAKVMIDNNKVINTGVSASVATLIIIVASLHFFGLVNLYLQYKYFKNVELFRTFTFVMGFFSLFFILVNVVMLQEIGNEYTMNHTITGEWNLVFLSLFTQGLFALLLFIQSFVTCKKLLNTKPVKKVKDESLFLTVHQVGIITAIAGFLLLYLVNNSMLPKQYVNGLLFMLSVIALVPYIIVASYWLNSVRKTRFIDWFDEKQLSDVSRGALVTLAISVSISVVFYFLSTYNIMINTTIYFPLYIFETLLLFSGITFYLSKKSI